MLTRILASLALLALAACQQLPESTPAPAGTASSARLMQNAAAGASSDAQRGPYGAAIVKDLVIGNAGVAIKPLCGELGALFGTAFRETLQREGYVRLALPEESTAEVVIIEPATMRVTPSELEIAVAVRDSRGRLLGWYAAQYSSGTLPGKDGLRRMFADAGEQVAKAIAKAR